MRIQLKRVIVTTFLMLVFNGVISAQWTLVTNKDNIKVYSKPSGKGMSFYKAEAIINTHIDTLYTFFVNFSLYPKWVNNCSYVDVLKQEKDSLYVYYSFFDMPWPASDRDGISKLAITHVSPGLIRVKSKAVEWTYPKKQDVIRLTRFEEKYVLNQISPGKVKLEMQGAYDPGGAVPDWLVKRLLVYGPYDVIVKIRSFVE